MTDSPNEQPSQLALGMNTIRKLYSSNAKHDFFL
jgi:hypothetical protein